MLLMNLMSIKETEEAIELLREKLALSKEKYGLNDTRTVELNRQLTLYINHHEKLITQPTNISNENTCI